MNRLFAALLAFAMIPAATAADFEEGIHYRALSEQLPTATGDKVEVRELFWYHCPHCYNLEGPLRAWVENMPDNAAFVAMPAILNDSWAFHARVFYTLDALGVVDEFHGPMLNAIHAPPRPLNRVGLNPDPNEVQRAAEVVGAWLEDNGGPSQQAFTDAWASFAVDTHTRNARLMTGKYEITGVPSLAVGGRYITSVSMAGNADQLFEVVEHLIGLSAGQ